MLVILVNVLGFMVVVVMVFFFGIINSVVYGGFVVVLFGVMNYLLFVLFCMVVGVGVIVIICVMFKKICL